MAKQRYPTQNQVPGHDPGVQKSFIGCASSAPDGSSPRVWARALVTGCRLELSIPSFSSNISSQEYLRVHVLSGARPALPMGVAPESRCGCLRSVRRLKLCHSNAFFCRSFLQIFMGHPIHLYWGLQGLNVQRILSNVPSFC